jgi:hypothetical protein
VSARRPGQLGTGFHVPRWTPIGPPGTARSVAEAYGQPPLEQRSNVVPFPRPEIRENERLARLATQAPRVPWDVFIGEYLRWRPGEHVALIGPTGQGKTNMLLNLLPLHRYVVVFATKPRDSTMSALVQRGYLKMDRWRSLDPDDFPRRVLWPDATTLDSGDRQREIFGEALGRIYREGGWTVAIDELWYVANVLHLERAVKMYLLQARSLGISLLVATQRPAWVPVEVYDQSTHLMFFRDNDERNLDRISGIAFRSAATVRDIVSNLDAHQVLYVNTRTGQMVRTRSPEVKIENGQR